MEKKGSQEPTQKEIDRFIADIQTRRPDQPFNLHEEMILIGAFSRSRREGLSIVEALEKSREETKASHNEQISEMPRNAGYTNSLDKDYKFYEDLIALVSSKP